MSPYIWLGVWFLMLAGSVAAHEAGHLVVGRRYGWDYAGFTMRLTGPKVLLGHSSPRREDWNLGRVALAGPLATLVACLAELDPMATTDPARKPWASDEGKARVLRRYKLGVGLG